VFVTSPPDPLSLGYWLRRGGILFERG